MTRETVYACVSGGGACVRKRVYVGLCVGVCVCVGVGVGVGVCVCVCVSSFFATSRCNRNCVEAASESLFKLYSFKY